MRRSATFRSLRYRNARLFFGGILVSQVGSWLQMTAMSIVVYRLTGSGTDVGLTLFAQFLPMLLLGVWAGAIADRVDKRRMAIWTQSSMAVQALVVAALELAGVLTFSAVFVLSLVLGVLSALDNPARRGLAIELVPTQDIANVVGLNTAVMTGARIFGPALAAALIDPLGAGVLFLLNGVSFAAIVWPIARMDPAELFPSPPAPRGGRPVRESLSFVRHHHTLALLFAVFTVVGTFAFNYGVSLLKIADVRFGDEVFYGWLLALTSVGSVIGSLITAGRARVTMGFFFGHTLLLGVSGVALSWSPNVAVAMVVALPLGLGGAALIASLNAITQQESPPEMRGRLLALGAVAFLGTTPIGAPITGWVADRVSAEWSLAYGSVIAIAGAIVGAALHRRSAPRRNAMVPGAPVG